MGIKNFYVLFQKSSKLKDKYAVVQAELHRDAEIYADYFWGTQVYKVTGSTYGYQIKNDPRYTELKRITSDE